MIKGNTTRVRWRRGQANSFHNERVLLQLVVPGRQAYRLVVSLLFFFCCEPFYSNERAPRDRRKNEQSMMWSRLMTLHLNACCSAPCLILCAVASDCGVWRELCLPALCVALSAGGISHVSIGPRVPLHSYVWAAQCWRCDGMRRSAQKQYCEEKWKTKNARDKKSFKSLCTYFSVGRYSTKCCY